jgi:hypothetical protein
VVIVDSFAVCARAEPVVPRWAVSIARAALPRKRRRFWISVCNIGDIVLLLASVLIACPSALMTGNGAYGLRRIMCCDNPNRIAMRLIRSSSFVEISWNP